MCSLYKLMRYPSPQFYPTQLIKECIINFSSLISLRVIYKLINYNFVTLNSMKTARVLKISISDTICLWSCPRLFVKDYILSSNCLLSTRLHLGWLPTCPEHLPSLSLLKIQLRSCLVMITLWSTN